jgi:GTPase SAR1 family protein
VAIRPEAFFKNGTSILGHTASGRKVFLPEEALDSHILVLGKTGMGKSTVLNSLCESIVSGNFGNVILIDPHETLSKRLLSVIESDRIYAITPTMEIDGDLRKSLQFNVLSNNGTSENREVISGWIRDLFFHEEVFSGGTWGPRLEVVFRVLLTGYMEDVEAPTLEGFMQLVANTERIRDYLKKAKNKVASSYFRDLAVYQKSWTEYISSTVNKLLPIVTNGAIHNLISGENQNDSLKEFLGKGSGFVPILMDNSSMSEETYRMVSILLLSFIFNIIRSLSSSTVPGRNYVIIDEAQSLPAGIILRLLNEGRKYGIRLILSTQHLKGLTQEISRSVMANVGTFISFSVSGDDAQTLSDNIFPYPANRRISEIMKAQGRHSALVWNLSSDGQNGPLSFRTEPVEEVEVDISRKIIRDSILRYGSVDVEKAVLQKPEVHQGILEKFRDLIIKNDIKWQDSRLVSGHIPDGLFLHGGTEYIVEVENSDLGHKFRLLQKIAIYSGRKIIFICREGGGNTALEMIMKPTFVGEKNGLMLEIPMANNESTLHFRDMGDFLNNVIILESGPKGFNHVRNGKSTHFSLARLSKRFGSGNYMTTDQFLTVKTRLYDIMVQTGIPFISISSLVNYSDLNPEHLREFFKSIGKETATFPDLFKRQKNSD